MRVAGIVTACVLVPVLLFGLSFGSTHLQLWWKSYFAPKFQSVDREVFEQTKSYTHGKMQDLAKYYEEYQKAESPGDKTAIQAVIQMRFADFDETTINSERLRMFLVSMRGF